MLKLASRLVDSINYIKRKILRPKYKDIVNDYRRYLKLQNSDFCSFESDNPVYRQGQEQYIRKIFAKVPRSKTICDIACGDGVGLNQFRKMKFTTVVGVDINTRKLLKAKKSGYKTIKSDIHNLKTIRDKSFDIVYSSHTLEHAYDPGVVLNEFHRILKSSGDLYLVLPYPETGKRHITAHGAIYELGLDKNDKAHTLVSFVQKRGFALATVKFNSFRQPEVWLHFKSQTLIS